jgi:hypothetical protein
MTLAKRLFSHEKHALSLPWSTQGRAVDNLPHEDPIYFD